MGSSVGGMLLFSFIWLALAAALIWVVAYLVRRDSAMRASNPHVKILAQQALGPRERVVVLNVLNRILVVGHTPSQINLIAELEPEDVANLKPQTASIDFANNLRQFLDLLVAFSYFSPGRNPFLQSSLFCCCFCNMVCAAVRVFF